MISTPLFVQTLAGKIGEVYRKLRPLVASTADAAFWPDGSIQEDLESAATYVSAEGGRVAQMDLLPVFTKSASAVSLQAVAKLVAPTLASLDAHCKKEGKKVDASISGLKTFLAYYNGGGGGDKFENLVSPDFAAVWEMAGNASLPSGVVGSPGVHPELGDGSAYGMGQRAVGADYLDGDPTDANSVEVQPLLEIVEDFADSTARVDVVVFGTDDADSDATTWSVQIIDTFNPASAVSATTVTAVPFADETRKLSVSSLSGIVPGSVLTLSSGLVDQETIVVDDVSTLAFHPDQNSAVSSAGMGTLHYGTPFVEGMATDAMGEVSPMVEVVDDFAGSSEPPVISVEGIDHTGIKTISGATNADPIVITSANHGLVNGNVIAIKNVGGNTSANGTRTVTKIDDDTFSIGVAGNAAYTSGGNWYMTWSATLTGNEPVSAVATTIVPAITILGRQTVAVASATGIVAGSVLRIGDGLETEECVSVLAISGDNITAVFKQTHLAGVAVAGKTTKALTPSATGRRLKKVVGMTITAADITEGGVRVVGKEDQFITAVFRKAHAAGAAIVGKRTYTMTPSVAGRRLRNVLTIQPITAADLSAGTVRVVGRRDSV